MRRIEVPVLVVGCGPVGAMAAILLARQGVASRVVERRAGPQEAPAAHAVNARTFEICRAAGVDMAAVAAACKPPADAGRVLWVTTLAGEELGRLPYERQDEEVLRLTPTPLRNLSQHRFEPILLDTLRGIDDVRVCHGEEWLSAEQDASGVISRVRAKGGEIYEVRSRWLVAADGAGSVVRKAAGIEAVGPSRLSSFVMIHFEASLRSLVRDRPAVLYWTTHPDAGGTFVAHDIDSTWVYMHAFDPERESREDFDEERCAAIVRRALGTDSHPFVVRTISTWTMTAQVAERYRAGRTFLVGDAAHRFPPTGGMGLNTGVQDAHNLAWKIAAVESGRAGEVLLDTYEAERRPVAQTNATVSVENALRLLQVQEALGEVGDAASFAAAIADPARRARVREAIAGQAEHFDMLGLQLGFAYESGALVPDGSAAPARANPVREYVPTARPGSRLPHAWLDDGVARPSAAGARRDRSTLDLLPLDRFTLVAGPSGGAWVRAAAAVGRVPLACARLGQDLPDPEGALARLFGIGPEGALLVRPDQHVAWRSHGGRGDPTAALEAVLAQIVPAPRRSE